MKGYKVFNSDWTCKDMQYEVGKTYEMEEKPVICVRGFHFCEKAADCFQYYRFDSDNKVAEIEAYGELDFEDGGNKHCTNKIKIVRELSWHEVLDLVNTGKACTGLCNTGDWNLASNCVGCFNTIDKPIMFFDKLSNVTLEEWRKSKAYKMLNNIDLGSIAWVESKDMTDEEKENHPEYKTTGGYLKIRETRDCCNEWWKSLTDKEKAIIKAIPNFDPEKFRLITGIDVGEE
ncbi:DUF7666 domain-containing protein [Bacteroides heparinolyticus]|uniref:DUF7666 domain-containing protein n=1 Tax=Prevotella heparinolytica TaxID=28113 RepID=UPI0035A100FA